MTDEQAKAVDETEDVTGHRHFERPEEEGTETPPARSAEDSDEPEDDVEGHSFLSMLPGIEGRAEGEPL